MSDRAPLQSSATTLRVLSLLLRHFTHGLSNKEIASALKIEPSAVTRHVQVLDAEGFAERVPETNRIRASVKLAQSAHAILIDLERGALRYQELHNRIHTH